MTGEIGCGSLLQPRPNENASGQESKNETCTICLFLLSVGHRPNGRKFFMTPKNFEQVQIQQQTTADKRVTKGV